MFTQVLSDNAKYALAILGKSRLMDNAYLAGGTACALQLGHRISVDLDFFTSREFDSKKLTSSLRKIGQFKLERISWGTILGTMEGVKFSIFVYKHPLLRSCKSLFGIKLLNLRDIAAMKIDAIASRGLKRDFIDLYFICRQASMSLKEILSFYDHKYGKLSSNVIHIQKSLVYFVDAQEQEMPRMLKPCKWEEVKSFFEQEVKRLVLKDHKMTK